MSRAFVVVLIVLIACTKQEPRGGPLNGTSPSRTCNEKAPLGNPHTTGGECASDADCKSGTEGRCSFLGQGRFPPANRCTYDACISDQQCGAGKLCMCNAGFDGRNVCIPSNCHDDTDCAAGAKCALSSSGVGDNPTFDVSSHYCKTGDDKCADDKACDKGEVCAFDPKRSRWQCMTVRYPPPG
jgi:hypothetical protein